MSNTPSKLKGKCLQAIRDQPGILQSELAKMGIGHRSSIIQYVFSLCFNGSVVRVRDEVMRSYRLYPKGKEPHINREDKSFRCSLFSNNPAYHDINKQHGDKFRMAFDAAFGLFDLEILQLAKAVTENDKLW